MLPCLLTQVEPILFDNWQGSSEGICSLVSCLLVSSLGFNDDVICIAVSLCLVFGPHAGQLQDACMHSAASGVVDITNANDITSSPGLQIDLIFALL